MLPAVTLIYVLIRIGVVVGVLRKVLLEEIRISRVDGKGNGTYNADFCLFMENWMNKLATLQSGKLSQEQFDTWKRETLDYYSDNFFSDFTSQITKDRKVKEPKKKSGISSIQIVSTLEEEDNE